MTRMIFGAFVLVSLGLPVPTLAQDTTQTGETEGGLQFEARAYWENDGTILKRNHAHDRHYTNGAGGSYVFSNPGWVQGLADAMPDADWFGQDTDEDEPGGTAFGFVLAQDIYTPRDLGLNPPDPTDRPYVGYLYVGPFVERANAHTLDHVQLDIGLVGPSTLAEEVQKEIHDYFDAEYPEGWSHQIKDEPTIQLTLRRKWKYDLVGAVQRLTGYDQAADARDAHAGFGLEVLPHVGLGVGTRRRYAEGGAMLRAGWNLPRDFGPGRLGDVRDGTSIATDRGFNAYGFVRATGRFVQYDLVIDGSTFRDGPGVTSEPLVGELWGGFSLGYQARNLGLYLTYSQVFLSDQFKNQTIGDSYGAVSLGLKLTF